MAYNVLSMDPGTTNYAYSVLRVSDTMNIRVVSTGLIQNTVQNPALLNVQSRSFMSEVRMIEYHVGAFDHVVAERFQSRGLKGVTIESVNMMLGILSQHYPGLALYTASTWKNAFNRAFDNYSLNDLYLDLKNYVADQPKKERLTVHELDCTLMGIYHMSKVLGAVPYARFDMDKMQKLMRHTESRPKL